MNDAPTPAPSTKGKLGPFKWDDALLLDSQLTDDERAIRDLAHVSCQDKLLAPVKLAFPHDHFHR